MAIDNLGRDTGELKTSQLLSGLTKQVSEVMETSDGRTSGQMNSLLQSVNNLSDVIGDNFAQNSRDAGGYARQIISAFENIHRKESRQESRDQSQDTVYAKQVVNLVDKIYKMGKSPKTFWVGIGHFHPDAENQLKKVLMSCGLCKGGSKATDAVKEAAMRRHAGTGGARGGASGGVAEIGAPGGVMGGGGMKFMGIAKGLTAAAHLLTAASSRLMSAFDVNVMSAFDGVLANANAFRMRIRDIVYQTRGFGDLNRDIEKQYNDVSNAAYASGVSIGKTMQLWTNNLQRGLAMENALVEEGKDRNKIMADRIKKTMRVQTTAMHAAKQLNMSVDGMNNLFMDWRMHLGMGVLEIQQMGRGMQDVARATGLTGAELERAVKATDQIMKKMKNAGRLSAESAKSVMGMMAAAQKYGVGDQMGRMMEALSSPRGFLEASNQMKALMVRAAQLSGDNGLATRVMFGQATSPSDLIKMSQGFEETIRRSLKGFGIDDAFVKSLGFDKLDMTDLSSVIQELEMQGDAGRAKARNLQLHLEQAYGMGIGEIEQMSKAMREAQEANKPFGDRLNTMTAELKKMEDAGMGATDAANELRARMRETNTTALQDGFTAWQKAVQRNNGDMVAAQRDVEQRLQSTMGPEMAREFANNIGGKAGELLEDLRARAQEQGKDLNSLLERRGFTMSQIKAAMTSGDAGEMENAMSVLNEAQQEIGRKEREGQDPITEIQGQIKDINTKLTSIVNSLLFKIPDALMKIIFWVATIGGLVTSLLGFFMSGAWIAGLFTGAGVPGGGGLMGMLGGGGAAAGGGGLAATASIAGAIVAPLMLIGGAIKGFTESEAAGRTKLEGSLLGMLTGGAGTGGGLLGSVLGTEEGTKADKAAGVGTAGLWGAGLGAAIGTAIAPGIGTAIGAALGGVIGMGTQFIKIITEGTDILSGLLEPFEILIEWLTGTMGNIWGIVKGIFTLDFNSVINNFMELIGRSLALIPSLLLSGLKAVFIKLPQLFLSALKGVFVDLPMMILDGIKSAFASLADNEWVGPIFQTLSEAFDEIHGAFMAIYEPIGEVFDTIIGVFQSIGEALFGASDGGSMLTKVLGIFKTAVHALATVIGWALKPVVWAAQAFRMLVDTVKAIVNGIIAPFKWLYDVLVGNSIIPDLVFGIVEFFAMLPIKIMKALAGLALDVVGFFLELPGKIIGALGDLAGMIAGKVGEFIVEIPQMLLDAFKGVFVDFPVWLFETITGGLANLGSFLWDSITGALANLGQWIMDLIPGLGDAVKGFSENAEEFAKTREDEGNSVMHAAGGALGAAGDILTGDISGGLSKGWEATKEIGGAVVDTAAAVGTAVVDTAAAVGGAIYDTGAAVLEAANPFNWFDAGSREIQNSGLAMVHEGEMIIPKDIWESISAVGGGFGSGGGIMDAFSSLLDPVGLVGNALSGVGDLVGGAVDMINPFNWFGGGEGGGIADAFGSMFDPHGLVGVSGAMSDAMDMLNPFNWFGGGGGGGGEEVVETGPETILDYLVIAIDHLSSISDTNYAIAENLGAFASEAPTEALEKGIGEKTSGGGWMTSMYDSMMEMLGMDSGGWLRDTIGDLEDALGIKSESDKKSPVADAGKGLYYDMNSPMMTAFSALTNPVGAIASGIGSLFGFGGAEGGSISAGSGLDYKDQMKGTASASAATIGAIEQRLASEKAGSEGSGTGTAMGVSGLEGLMHEEVSLLGMIHEALEAIRANTNTKTQTKVVEAPGKGNQPPHAMGVKSIAMDYVRGYWDLTTGDYAPPAVTNDGRGGN